jgi:hypothetical protein
MLATASRLLLLQSLDPADLAGIRPMHDRDTPLTVPQFVRGFFAQAAN